MLQDLNLSETFIFRINSLQQELFTFFSLFKDSQKSFTNDSLKNSSLKSPQIMKNSQKDSPQNLVKDAANPLESYWKSLVLALSSEKEQLLKKLEKIDEISVENLQNRIKELELNLSQKSSQNENYWKSLILTLSSEKEQLLKKLENFNKNREIDDFHNRIKELEEVLQEKNSQIMGFNEIIEEWQGKYSRIEQDIHENGLDGLTKEETYEREISSLKEQISMNEKLLGIREAEILDYCETLSQRTEKQKNLENENRRFMIELNENRLKLSQIQKDFEEDQGIIQSLKEELGFMHRSKDLALIQEQKLMDLNVKFEDFKGRSFEKISNLANELERMEVVKADTLKGFEMKSQENQELLEMFKELEILTESQSKALSLKETQIENLETKIRLFENERSLFDKNTKELIEVKNRNKRCLETINNSTNEINGLKREIEGNITVQKSLQEKLFEKESIIIELNHQNKGFKGQLEKNSKVLFEKNAMINEIKTMKETSKIQRNFEEKLFEKEAVIIEMNQQIKGLFEKENIINELNQINKGLKKELEKAYEELEEVRKERDKFSGEYQKFIERNEKFMMDNDKFTDKLTVDMLNKEKNCEEFDEKIDRGAFLDVTNMKIMRNFNEESGEKHGSYRPAKKIMEERDLEIKRLSKIVKMNKF